MIRVRGIRPIYWGVERDPEDRRVLRPAWLVEDQEPWRKSIVAFRIRVWRYGLHLGLCRKQKPEERSWHGRYAPVSEIRKWRRLDEQQVVVEETGEAPSASVEVRQVE